MKKQLLVILFVVLLISCLTLVACDWLPAEYKLEFMVDGKVYKTISGDSALTLPENPSKDGYTFDGWYYDDGTWQELFSINFLVESGLTKDIIVYAKWTEATEHQHTFSNEWVSDENHHWHVSICGHSIEISGKSEHDFETVYNKDFTKEHQKCSVCEFETAETNHVHTGGEATCIVKATCTACGQQYGELLNHTEVVNMAIAPTCTETGLTDGAHCSVCSEILVAQQTIDALGHNEISHDAQAVSCEQIGWNAYITCSRCNYSTYAEIPAIGHSYVEYNSNNDATCLMDGTKTASCTNDCGKTDTIVDVGSALGHDEIYHNAQEPTCTEVGWEDHVTCSRCDYTTYVEIVAEGHNEVMDDSITATCTESGLTQGKHCDKCGEILIKQEIVDATGHKFVDYFSNHDASCGVDGTKTATCKNGCGLTDIVADVGSALEHDMNITEDSKPSCLQEGNTRYYQCDNCFKYFEDEDGVSEIKVNSWVLPALGHSYSSNWSYDEYYHWRTATCEHKAEVSEKEQHNYNDEGICVDCFYEKNTTVGLSYKLSSDTTYYIVTGIGVVPDTSIIIPRTYKNLPVKAIDTYAFSDCTQLQGISIPYSVFAIGNHAFSGCTNLQKVNYFGTIEQWAMIDFGDAMSNPLCYTGRLFINDTEVTKVVLTTANKIGNYAFYNYTGLDSLTIGDGVKTIGYSAFQGCANLTNVNYKGTIDQWAMINFSNYLSNPLYYTKSLYIDNQKVMQVNLTNVTNVSAYAFYNCEELTNITIPDSVISIGNQAFYGCSGLTKVNYLGTVDKWAMISFGDAMSNPLYYARQLFVNDQEVTQLDLAIATKVSAYAFYNCSSLSTLVVGSSVESIGSFAFSGCAGLLSVVIGNSVDSINANAFANCINLETVTFDENSSIKTIEEYAFYNCGELLDIVFPDTLTSIGKASLSGCNSLQSLTVPFVGGGYDIGDNVKYKYLLGYIFGEERYTGGVETQQYYFGTGSTTPTTHITYYIPATLKFVTITSGPISSGAFNNCTGLAKVVLGDRVTSIGNCAFYNCVMLNSITIGADLSYMSHGAFIGCTHLTKVNYTGTVDQWAQISFSDTVSNPLHTAKHLYINDEEVLTADLSETKLVSAYAFYNCLSLTNVIISNNIVSIGASAFYNCTNLTKVDYVGAIDQWASIDFASANSNPLYYAKHLFIDNVEVINVDLSDVSSICAYAFVNGTALESVTIGVNTNTIGQSAFYGCSELLDIYYLGTIDEWVNIVFQDGDANPLKYANNLYIDNNRITEVDLTSATHIRPYAFANWQEITKIIISSSLKVIGDEAFKGCVNLTTVVFEQDSQLQAIGVDSFRDCTSLTSIVIPNSTVSICDRAFYWCTSLENVTIGNNVTSIGEEAFYYCTNLTEINFNATDLEDLSSDNKVFYSTGLSSDGIIVQIGDNVTRTPAYLFSACTKITNVVFDENSSCTEIGSYAFYNCVGLTNITLPNQITAISYYAFYNCKSLTSIVIPDTVAEIKDYAFTNCTNLGIITLSEIAPLRTIGAHAFANCTNLISITIPDSVVQISHYAFYECKCLENVAIGNGTTSIGNYAFANCSSLMSIIWGDEAQITTIGNYVFANCSLLESIVIPNNITSIGYGAFSCCSGLVEIDYNAYSMEDVSLNDNIFYNAGANETGMAVRIGANVTKIPAYLFYDSKVISLIFSDNNYCTSIGESAFANCVNLVTVDFGANSKLEVLCSRAFYGCTELSTIIIPDSIISIGERALHNCSSLESIIVEENNSVYHVDNNCLIETASKTLILGCKNSIVPTDGSVISIGNYAFYGCTELLTITIPESIVSIGEYAFYNCVNLVCIDFNAISMGDLSSENYVFVYAGISNAGMEVNVGKGVTTIPAYLFRPSESNTKYAPNITSLNFVDDSDCQSIGESAFRGCIGLTSVDIPANVISLGASAFRDCLNLVEINYNATSMEDFTAINYVFDNAGKNSDGVTVNIGENVTRLPARLFCTYNSPNIATVVFANNSHCNFIGISAFDNCTELVSITIPNSVTLISDRAFNNCTSLETVIFEENSQLQTINNNAFYGCTSLTSVVIPDSVTTIGSGAFGGCSRLTEIVLPFVGVSATATEPSEATLFGYIFGINNYSGGVKTEQCYSQYSFATYYIPAALKSVTVNGGNIFYGAFNNCINLKSIFIAEAISYIEESAFSGCSGLTEIVLPFVGVSATATEPSEATLFGYIFGTNNYIGGVETKQYYSQSSFVSYYIPLSLKSVTITGGNIGYGAFYNCEKLASIIIGNSVTSIGDYAFYNCIALISIKIPESVNSIGVYAFYNCQKLIEINNLSSIIISAGSTDNGYVGYYAKNIYTSTEGQSNLISTDDGFIFYNDNGKYYLMGYVGSETNIVLPADEKWGNYSVYAYAFYDHTNLTSVTIPDCVVTIGDFAFSNCSSLTNLTIGQSVQTIGKSAFKDCVCLSTINLNATALTSLSSSTDHIFQNAGTSVDGMSVYVGANVTRIPNFMFCEQNVVSVIFEDNSNCASIGNSAFANCSNLTNVTLPQSVLTVGSVSIGMSAFRNCVGLTTIIIPDSVTYIDDYAFSYCETLANVSIGRGVGHVGYRAFYECTSLESIVVAEGNTDYCSKNNCLISLYNNSLILGCKNSIIPADGSVAIIGGDAFYNCAGLTSITIPNSVTTIGSSAFYNCAGLTSITIPDSVTTIGHTAFYNCSSLTSVTILDSATSIGDSAFSRCSNLSNVVLGNGVTAIGGYSFAYCPNLTSIRIGDGVTIIDHHAFYNCTSLEEVLFGESSQLQIISNDAFQGCSKLTSIIIPDSVTTIEERAFYDCKNLSNITIGSGIASIGGMAFYNCTSLSRVDYNGTIDQWAMIAFGDELSNPIYYAKRLCIDGQEVAQINLTTATQVSDYAFYNFEGLTKVTIGDSVTAIGKKAFRDCTGMIDVIFVNGTISIGDYAFQGCRSLTSITISSSVTFIGEMAFSNCTSLSRVDYNGTIDQWVMIDFDNSSGYTSNPLYYAKHLYIDGHEVTQVNLTTATKISPGAFKNCEGLTRVIISDSVIAIGREAFYNCKSLTSIIIPDSVTSIGSEAFFGCSDLVNVTIPNSVTFIGYRVFDNCNNLQYYEYDNGLYLGNDSNNYTVLIKAQSTAIESCKINENTKIIGAYAFYECRDLTEIIIPSSVVYIGDSAFNSCRRLSSVTFGENSQLTTIDASVFQHCESLINVIIPEGVESIGYMSFFGCSSLASITIPNSAIIYSEVLGGCSNLTTINYLGTTEEWIAITENRNWYPYPKIYTIYCIDGRISGDGTITYN